MIYKKRPGIGPHYKNLLINLGSISFQRIPTNLKHKKLDEWKDFEKIWINVWVKYFLGGLQME